MEPTLFSPALCQLEKLVSHMGLVDTSGKATMLCEQNATFPLLPSFLPPFSLQKLLCRVMDVSATDFLQCPKPEDTNQGLILLAGEPFFNRKIGCAVAVGGKREVDTKSRL